MGTALSDFFGRWGFPSGDTVDWCSLSIWTLKALLLILCTVKSTDWMDCLLWVTKGELLFHWPYLYLSCSVSWKTHFPNRSSSHPSCSSEKILKNDTLSCRRSGYSRRGPNWRKNSLWKQYRNIYLCPESGWTQSVSDSQTFRSPGENRQFSFQSCIYDLQNWKISSQWNGTL